MPESWSRAVGYICSRIGMFEAAAEDTLFWYTASVSDGWTVSLLKQESGKLHVHVALDNTEDKEKATMYSIIGWAYTQGHDVGVDL